jgi:pyruvate,water dikinase
VQLHGSVRRPWRLYALALASITLFASTSGHAASSSVAPSRIRAGTFYNGAAITVTGSVGELSQVVVRLVEPSPPQTYNHRGKIGGLIWGGIEHVTFRGAPGLYGLYTSAAIASMASPALRTELGLGYEVLRSEVDVTGTQADKALMLEHLVRLKEREGLYRLAPGTVQLGDVQGGRREFHVTIQLPAVTPPGAIDVTVFEFAHGSLVTTDHLEVRLDRGGMPDFLYRLSREHGLAFGFLAVVVSLATGLGTGLLSRRRLGGGPPAARQATLFADLSRALHDMVRPRARAVHTPADVAALRSKYEVFRDLLAVNNELLGLLAELEEEASWTSFRQPRVRMGIRAMFDGTADMVALLNRLSGDRYFDLVNVISSIRSDVMEFLATINDTADPRLTLGLSEISSGTAGAVGGKAVNLARLECDLGLRVPPFFVITTEAYREFLERDGLGSKLRALLAPARLDAPVDFQQRCELAQGLVEQAAIPPALLDAVEAAWTSCGIPDAGGVALRSSAAGEDSELSFAGQFETVLNVPRHEVGGAWRQVVRSRFAARAVFYRRAAGVAEVDTPMAVLVQRMVRSRASGVLFTRQPNDPRAPVMLLTSVFGLGPEASGGTASADQLVVSRRAPHQVLEHRIARKAERLASADGAGIARLAVDPQEQLQISIDDREVAALCAQALRIEDYFGCPQDMEWTIDTEGTLWMLQARPLRIEREDAVRPDVPKGTPLLLCGGEVVWGGRAVGAVHIARTREDEDRLPTGALLVANQLLPDCVRFLPRVCGLIVERGSITGHAASIVREFRVPSLFGVEGALDKLVEGQVVSLDAANRRVYGGMVWPELRGQLPMTVLERRTVGLPTVLASKLTKLSGSSFMGSWACQSLHDVIRFTHEMAVQAMFEIGDRLLGSSIGGVKKLKSSPQIQMHVVDLGGGVRPEASAKRELDPDDVVSIPFRALWNGLADLRFESNRGDAPHPHSFAAVVASTMASVESRELGAPNYACVTDTYLNLNSRQAYHFAIVDAFLCDNQNNNHISLRLKGGGAAPWQRSLRVQFMAEVLRSRCFTVDATGDLLNAWYRGIDRTTGGEALTMIGHLLRYSAQLDMWMTDERRAKDHVAAFVQAEELACGTTTRVS